MSTMAQRITAVLDSFDPVRSNECKLRSDVITAMGGKMGVSRSHPDGVTHSYTFTASWAEVERGIDEDDAMASFRERERMFVP